MTLLRESQILCAAAACPVCGTATVTTFDAIGRTRTRCPGCDRVAPPQRHHPDDAFVPQTLVRVASALPVVRPGQLRCQRCARGVQGNVARFCEPCHALRQAEREAARAGRVPVTYTPRRCLEPSCGALFTPRGPRSSYCEECS